jgi:hypothetical protein
MFPVFRPWHKADGLNYLKYYSEINFKKYY